MTNPHLEYTEGPTGKVVNWKAFSADYPEHDDVQSTVEDRRDNRDPEQVWHEILASRNGAIQGQLRFPDEVVFGK